MGESSASFDGSQPLATTLAGFAEAPARERGVPLGSWARGDADALSDVDLIVVAPSTRPVVDRFRD